MSKSIRQSKNEINTNNTTIINKVNADVDAKINNVNTTINNVNTKVDGKYN